MVLRVGQIGSAPVFLGWGVLLSAALLETAQDAALRHGMAEEALVIGVEVVLVFRRQLVALEAVGGFELLDHFHSVHVVLRLVRHERILIELLQSGQRSLTELVLQVQVLALHA